LLGVATVVAATSCTAPHPSAPPMPPAVAKSAPSVKAVNTGYAAVVEVEQLDGVVAHFEKPDASDFAPGDPGSAGMRRFMDDWPCPIMPGGTFDETSPYCPHGATNVALAITYQRGAEAGWCQISLDDSVSCTFPSGTIDLVGAPTKPAAFEMLASDGVDSLCLGEADGTVGCFAGDLSGSPHVIAGVQFPAQLRGDNGATCALMPDATVLCWGKNDRGQLGNGTTVDSATPVAVLDENSNPIHARSIDHGCAALVDGSVACWQPTVFEPRSGLARPVAGVANAFAISINSVSCAMTDNNGAAQLVCWGWDQNGFVRVAQIAGN
jgi:hypothetical protein